MRRACRQTFGAIRSRVSCGAGAVAVLCAVATAGAGPATRPDLRHLPLPAVPSVPSNVATAFDVRYGPGPGASNMLDVYAPRGATVPCPTVVWIHGGGWIVGDKRPARPLPLVQAGFVVVSVNYRLTTLAPYPAQIEDCKGAVRFLRAHAAQYHIDPDHIGVWGESAGGHLAALMGTSGADPHVEGTVGGNAGVSSRVQAVCDWFGPTDLTQFAAQTVAAGHAVSTYDTIITHALFGGPPEDHADLIALSNPIHFLPTTAGHGADVPPFLIMHGDRDRTVPLGQSKLLADALTATGANVVMRVVPGLGHGFTMARHDVGPVALEFFRRTLGDPAGPRGS